MAAGSLHATRARIAALVEPVVAAAGFDLEDLGVTRAGRRSVVRLIVDADGGVTLDDIAAVSRAVSGALDGADETMLGAGPYTLEVTSPGVDRPLVEPRHWRRNVSRLVTVRVGAHTVTGRIVAADADGVTLELPDGRRDVPFSGLGAGAVQVEFSRPGGGAPADAVAVAAERGAVDDGHEGSRP